MHPIVLIALTGWLAIAPALAQAASPPAKPATAAPSAKTVHDATEPFEPPFATTGVPPGVSTQPGSAVVGRFKVATLTPTGRALLSTKKQPDVTIELIEYVPPRTHLDESLSMRASALADLGKDIVQQLLTETVLLRGDTKVITALGYIANGYHDASRKGEMFAVMPLTKRLPHNTAQLVVSLTAYKTTVKYTFHNCTFTALALPK